MTKTETTGRSCCDTAEKAWVGREAEDVEPGWMDNILHRLLLRANVQLLRIENEKVEEAVFNRAGHDKDSRILARLVGTVEQLIRFETERAALRARKASDDDEGALQELIRKIDREAEALGTDSEAEKTE